MAESWVTLATNDTYCLGALVLAESLKAVATTRSKVILITPDVSTKMKDVLNTVYDVVKVVDCINSNDEKILKVMKRPELGVTLTKIHCWSLTEYQKCVFLDSDTLFMKNADELFEREELSAVCDIGWPDCFNSGVFVFKPSTETFNNLVQLANEEGSFDGGDQGLLNTYFSDWSSADISKHLSFIYNMTLIAAYSYPPAYKRFGKNVKIVHFLGSMKPWFYGFDSKSGTVIQPVTAGGHPPQELDHVQKWWDIFVSEVQPKLSQDCLTTSLPQAGLAAALATLNLSPGSEVTYPGAVSDPAVLVADDVLGRRKKWESGNVDYMGTDSYEHIQEKLNESISKLP